MKLESVLTTKIVDNFGRFGMPYQESLGTRLVTDHEIVTDHEMLLEWNGVEHKIGME